MLKLISLFLPLLVSIFLLSCSGGGGSGGSTTAQDPSSSNSITIDGTYMVNIYSLLDGNKTEGILVANQEANISTINLQGNDVKLRLTSKNGVVNITPFEVSQLNQTITFTTPLNTIDGNISLIQGDETLHTMAYKVYKAHKLYLTSIEPEVAQVGDTLTINGQNFEENMQLISTDNDFNQSVSSA